MVWFLLGLVDSLITERIIPRDKPSSFCQWAKLTQILPTPVQHSLGVLVWVGFFGGGGDFFFACFFFQLISSV